MDFWFQLHTQTAEAMVGVDTEGSGETDSGVFSFAGAGLWFLNGDTGEWSRLHGTNPIHLAAGNLDGSGGDEVIADFAGFGLWIYSAGGWSQLHGSDVSTMMTADLDANGKQDLVVTFPGFGIWAVHEPHHVGTDQFGRRAAGHQRRSRRQRRLRFDHRLRSGHRPLGAEEWNDMGATPWIHDGEHRWR